MRINEADGLPMDLGDWAEAVSLGGDGFNVLVSFIRNHASRLSSSFTRV